MATFLTSTSKAAGDTVLATQYNSLLKDIVQIGGDYATSTGSANAYALSISSQISAYTAGQAFKFKANFVNTGPATLNVNALGAKNILKNLDEPLSSGDIKSGQVIVVVYDGTSMLIVGYQTSILTLDSVTTGEAIDGTATVPLAVCIKLSDNLAYKADANDTSRVQFIGFINTNASISTKPSITVGGTIGGFSGLTIGATYYVSDTAGAISATPSTTTVIPVGRAVSATEILINAGRKIAIVTASHSAAAGATETLVKTIGFRPSLITASFTLEGKSDGTTRNARGTATWFGTTLASAWVMGEIHTATQMFANSYQTNYGLELSTRSLNPAGGSDYSYGTLSISAIDNTSFSSRWVNTLVGGSGQTIGATVHYVAFE